MQKITYALPPSLAKKKSSTMTFGFLFVILNMAYFSKMTAPVDEAKWLLLQVVAPAMALFFTGKAIFKHENIELKITALQISLLLLFTLAAASGGWALNQIAFPANLLDMSSLIIVMVFFSATLHHSDQELLTFFLGLFSTLVAVVGILQYFGLDGDLYYQYVKPASFFVNKNFASPIVAASLPLFGLNLISGAPPRRRIVLLTVFQINFAYLFFSGTKSSWLAYFATMAVFTSIAFNFEVYSKHFTRNFLMKTLALITSGVALSLLLGYIHNHGPFPVMSRDPLAQTGTLLILTGCTAISPILMSGAIHLWRISSGRHRLLPHIMWVLFISGATTYLFSQASDLLERINASLATGPNVDPMLTSWSARIPLWLNSLAIVRDHPFRGVGLGSFDAAYPLYHNSIMHDIVYSSRLWLGGAHNDLLQMLVELGMGGFVLTILCFVMISCYFHDLVKNSPPSTMFLLTGCYFGLLALVLESMFSPVLHQPSCLILLAIFAGTIHSALYANPSGPKHFIFRIIIPPKKRLFYLTPLAVLFFLMLSISAPWAARRYQGFVYHKEAIAYFKAKMDDSCYMKLREAENSWPYSSTIVSETATASYLYLQRHFTDDNLQQARNYNQQALRALPYYYNANLVRISLLKYSPEGRSEISTYAPLLLKIAPANKMDEARQAINF